MMKYELLAKRDEYAFHCLREIGGFFGCKSQRVDTCLGPPSDLKKLGPQPKVDGSSPHLLVVK